MSPEAIARWRLACGIFLIVTSRPFLEKMLLSLANTIGANPVHPEIPIDTLDACPRAGVAISNAASAPATVLIEVITPLHLFQIALTRCHHGKPGKSTSSQGQLNQSRYHDHPSVRTEACYRPFPIRIVVL